MQSPSLSLHFAPRDPENPPESNGFAEGRLYLLTSSVPMSDVPIDDVYNPYINTKSPVGSVGWTHGHTIFPL